MPEETDLTQVSPAPPAPPASTLSTESTPAPPPYIDPARLDALEAKLDATLAAIQRQAQAATVTDNGPEHVVLYGGRSGLEDIQIEDKGAMAVDERYADVQMKEHVREALNRLPEAERKLLTLYYFKEMSLQEVGNELGLSKSWTSRRHAQAVEKLSRILQDIIKESTI